MMKTTIAELLISKSTFTSIAVKNFRQRKGCQLRYATGRPIPAPVTAALLRVAGYDNVYVHPTLGAVSVPR